MVTFHRPHVPDALLSRLRRAGYARTYQDTITILRPVTGPTQRTTTGGLKRDVPPEPIATIRGRRARDFQPGREQNVGGAVTGVTYAVVYSDPEDAAPQPHDVLEIIGRYSPTTLRVNVTESEVLNTDPLERITRGTVIKPDHGGSSA
jgi:hypothetical protein